MSGSSGSQAGSDRVMVLGEERVPDIVELLCEAFFDYPVMRYVLGESEDYPSRLHTLVGYFTTARVHREEVMLGVSLDGRLAGVALVSRPGPAKHPEPLRALREAVWATLGAGARERYGAFGAATAPFVVEQPHIHLNMLGTLREARGFGLGRLLIERVHELSAGDPDSQGVTLTTEDPDNVALYRHFGYSVVGEAVVAPELRSWGFFRPDPGPTAS